MDGPACRDADGDRGVVETPGNEDPACLDDDGDRGAARPDMAAASDGGTRKPGRGRGTRSIGSGVTWLDGNQPSSPLGNRPCHHPPLGACVT